MIRLPRWAQPPVRYQICAVRRNGRGHAPARAGASSASVRSANGAAAALLQAFGFGLPPRG